MATLSVGVVITLSLAPSPTSPDSTQSSDSSSSAQEGITPTDDEPPQTTYTAFVINVHDWTQPDKSIATLNRILDLHTEYAVPVDIYLDDAVTQQYVTQAPELIERLKTDPNVAVSYHIRPPTPYYGGFHEEWFRGMNTAALYGRVMEYETHAIDLETGQPTSAPGGYQYVKELMGYAPIVAAQANGRTPLGKAVANVYRDLGAIFTLRHGAASAPGDTVNDLFLRPEDAELKVYERLDAADANRLIADVIATLPTDRSSFLNLKWHEDNFYTTGTPWDDVYLINRKDPKDPPYDIANWQSSTQPKTAAQQEIQWDRYEAMLQYVTMNTDTVTAMNARDLLTLIER